MNNYKSKDKDSKKSFDKKPYKKAKPADKSFGKPKRKPAEKSNDKSSENPEKKPFEKFSKKSFDKSSDKNFEKSDRKPYKKSSDKSNDKSYRKPYDKSGNKSFRKSEDKSTEKFIKESIGGIRLNKYIANSGICSRREADQLIETGSVTVNGELIIEMGHKVNKTDLVKVDGRAIKPEKNVYVLLNKPKDFITTSKDPQERKTVMNLVEKACEQRIYPVGRLDRMTTGVLLFTNDGDLAKKLTHPKYNVKKIYHVTLDKPLDKQDLVKILEGVELEDGFTPVDELAYNDPSDKKEIGIEIHSGKNRIIRRIFEHFGYTVVKLDRVLFAGLTKKNLTRGRWRILDDKEVVLLKRLAK